MKKFYVILVFLISALAAYSQEGSNLWSIATQRPTAPNQEQVTLRQAESGYFGCIDFDKIGKMAYVTDTEICLISAFLPLGFDFRQVTMELNVIANNEILASETLESVDFVNKKCRKLQIEFSAKKSDNLYFQIILTTVDTDSLSPQQSYEFKICMSSGFDG